MSDWSSDVYTSYLFPYVGPLHPSLRHLIVIPLGMSFRLFGVNKASVILPSLLYYAGLLAVTYVFLARFTNRHIAFIAVALITTLPEIGRASCRESVCQYV